MWLSGTFAGVAEGAGVLEGVCSALDVVEAASDPAVATGRRLATLGANFLPDLLMAELPRKADMADQRGCPGIEGELAAIWDYRHGGMAVACRVAMVDVQVQVECKAAAAS